MSESNEDVEDSTTLVEVPVKDAPSSNEEDPSAVDQRNTETLPETTTESSNTIIPPVCSTDTPTASPVIPEVTPPPLIERSMSHESNNTPFFDMLLDCLFAGDSVSVDMTRLRKISSQGLHDADDDDHTSYRGVTWRLLLGYLPANVQEQEGEPPDSKNSNEDLDVASIRTQGWNRIAQEKRNLYYSMVEEWFQPHVLKETKRGMEIRQQPRYRRRTNIEDDLEESTSSHNDNDPIPTTIGSTSSSSPPRHCPPSPAQPIPALLKDVWTKQHGRDWHVLNAVTNGLNALQFDQLVTPTSTESTDTEDTTTTNATDNSTRLLQTCTSSEERQYEDFVESAILLDEVRKDVVGWHHSPPAYEII